MKRKHPLEYFMKKNGFKKVSDILYRHKILGLILADEITSHESLLHAIFENGKSAKASEIKQTLNIR